MYSMWKVNMKKVNIKKDITKKHTYENCTHELRLWQGVMVGIEGFEPSRLVPQTSMLKNQYIIYPITFQRDRTWTCNHLHPKQAFYHLKYSLIDSEDRGLAPQTFSGSHYLAGRFWTFQIYLPYILYIKKISR